MSSKRTKNKPLAKQPPPDNVCPSCGLNMVETVGVLTFPVNGEDVLVKNSPHLFCRSCKEVMLRLDESRQLRKTALKLYQEKYGLLSADEIRRLRERLELTQGQLAELLRLGVNTVSRWESGRNVQTAAMDVLLRLVRDVPDSIVYLKKLVA